MAHLLKIYHNLPYSIRVITASMRGYYLRYWRYGKDTERLIAEALEREHWSPEQWKAWQEERLAYVLHRAATKVPFYRNYWNTLRSRGNRYSWEILENWPVLKKESVRKNPQAFVSDDCDTRQMFRESTSGTSGTPLTIYIKKNTLRQWYALFEARIRKWHGVSIKERWGIVGGQLVTPFNQTKPPFWVFNAGMNQIYLSTHHISAKNAVWYVSALNRYAPTHLIVYPSSAAVLAAYIIEQGLTPPAIKVIFSNAEMLLDNQRELIARGFRCSVRDTYGMGEFVAGASECEKGSLHLWPETGYIEIMDDDQDVRLINGKEGRVIATGLLNSDMPLIRYEVGDRGQLAEENFQCVCGRKLPVLKKIEGRLNDLVVTPDGRRIFWLNPVFYGLNIREAQIIQESISSLKVLYVPMSGYNSEDGMTIVKRMRDRVGDMDVTLEKTEHIPRAKTGKFKAVISLIDTTNN